MNRWKPRIGWLVAAVIAGAWMLDRPKEVKADIKPPQIFHLGVRESRQISPSEELRLITVPSQIPELFKICLLYTNKETHTSALSCEAGDGMAGLD